MVSIFEQGDIIQLDFEPHKGHEPSKVRPALVVSSDSFNRRSSLTAVCPITTTNSGYPLHVGIVTEEVMGFACIEQLRTLDLSARKCRFVAKASAEEMDMVLSYIGAVFGI